MARYRLGIPTNRGMQNVPLQDATPRDVRDAASLVADRIDNDEHDEVIQVLEAFQAKQGWGNGPIEDSYPDGNTYIYVSAGSNDISADEARQKLEELGVEV